MARYETDKRELFRFKEIGPVPLIEAVKKRGCLYDRNHPDYMDKLAQFNAWIEIVKELGFAEIFLRKKWKVLRDAFIKNHNRRFVKPNGKYVSKWRYYDHMLFLLPHTLKCNVKKESVEREEVVEENSVMGDTEKSLDLEENGTVEERNNATDDFIIECNVAGDDSDAASSTDSTDGVKVPPEVVDKITSRIKSSESKRHIPASSSSTKQICSLAGSSATGYKIITASSSEHSPTRVYKRRRDDSSDQYRQKASPSWCNDDNSNDDVDDYSDNKASETITSSSEGTEDEDMLFFRSIIPRVKQLDTMRKLEFKGEIISLLVKHLKQVPSSGDMNS